MSKTIDQTLQPYVEKILEGLEKGTEFAIDMAPELLQEFYAWHFWYHLIPIIVGVILLSVCILSIRGCMKSLEDEYTETGYFILAILSGTVGIGMVIFNLMSFVKLIVAPKLYLIEYFLN